MKTLRRFSPTFTLTLLIVLSCLLTACSSPGPRIEPDTTLAKPLNHWPSAAEVNALNGLVGETDQDVLKAIGHPSEIKICDDGSVTWEYPWVAYCHVVLKDNVVVNCFYTAGY